MSYMIFLRKLVNSGQILAIFSVNSLKTPKNKEDSTEFTSLKFLIFYDIFFCKTGKNIEQIGKGN